MSANNDLRLISRAIRERTIAPLLAAGVNADWFVDPADKQVFGYLVRHATKYGEVPSAAEVKANFPTYRILAVEDRLEVLVDHLVDFRRHQQTVNLLNDAVTLMNDEADAEKVLQLMGRVVTKILGEGDTGTRDVDLTRDPMSRWAAYEELKNLPDGLLGLPTGFNTIDEATAGLQGGQLVVIIAPPKAGKSTITLQFAINMHDQGHDTMLQSFEMSNSEQESRHDAMRAHINHNRLRRGLLKPHEESRYQQMLQSQIGMHPFVLLDNAEGSTVSAIAAKIELHRPKIVFIDGVYLMQDELSGEQNTPLALTNITRSLKRLAKRLDIPIVISTQTLEWKMKGNKVTAQSIGYSSSFFQDADVILGLERPDNEDEGTRILKVVASRNCPPAAVDLVWNWDEGRFTEATADAYAKPADVPNELGGIYEDGDAAPDDEDYAGGLMGWASA